MAGCSTRWSSVYSLDMRDGFDLILCYILTHELGMSAITTKKKSERLVARVSPQDKALLERAASLEGRSLASFAVEHLLAYARGVIEDREVIRLNEEQTRRFVETLIAPPRKPTPQFLEALRDYRENVVSDVNHSDDWK